MSVLCVQRGHGGPAHAACLSVVNSSRLCWLFLATPSSEFDASFHDVSRQQHRAGMRLQACLVHTAAHLSLPACFSFPLSHYTHKQTWCLVQCAVQCRQNSLTVVTTACFSARRHALCSWYPKPPGAKHNIQSGITWQSTCFNMPVTVMITSRGHRAADVYLYFLTCVTTHVYSLK